MRIIVLILAVASVFFFGRALGGLGGYLVGIARPQLVLQGLVGGVVTACLSLFLWHGPLRREEQKKNDPPSKEEPLP